MNPTEPIRDPNHVQALAAYFFHRGEVRNYVLIVMGVHTALRVSDMLRLRWDDVYDFRLKRVRRHFSLVERKTRKSKTVALNKDLIAALEYFVEHSNPVSGAPLFESRKTGRSISRVQAYRIISAAAKELDLGRISCHSLRKTFGYHVWKRGVSPIVIMAIYAHTSFATTKRYLGLEQDDKNAAYAVISFSTRPECIIPH
ncbi:MAG: tyrosine-type recombinase/integrase [Oscillospiraceae bacterium]|jgi:integrase|nr:tyrosine-type recombinase/integrase [Oscillospiraceae bacterium]